MPGVQTQWPAVSDAPSLARARQPLSEPSRPSRPFSQAADLMPDSNSLAQRRGLSLVRHGPLFLPSVFWVGLKPLKCRSQTVGPQVKVRTGKGSHLSFQKIYKYDCGEHKHIISALVPELSVHRAVKCCSNWSRWRAEQRFCHRADVRAQRTRGGGR